MSTPTPLASTTSAELFKSSINDYLENLPEAVHSQLYRSPETCLAIFRLLPSLAKFYIMTLLFQENAVPYSDLNRWIKQNMSSTSASHHRNPSKIYQNDSLKRLKALNLTKDIRKEIRHPQTKELTKIILVQLNPIFKRSFRNALTGYKPEKEEDSEMIDVDKQEDKEEEQVNEESSRVATDEPVNALNMMFVDDEVITVEFLDNYCLSKWENILHFMVGSEIPELPSIGVLTLLRHSGLMELESDRKKRENNDGIPVEILPGARSTPSLQTLAKLLITNHGFQFLLQDINSQIWTLLLQYLKMSEDLQLNPVDVLNFIFMLGSLELGEGYPIKMLSDTQVIMLEDLIDYGLIYYPSIPENSSEKVTSNRMFYPTRLATTLTSESCNFKSASTVLNQEISAATAENENNTPSSSRGSIIIETNFKIYCYTSSPLQIAILNLFVHLKARFTNMVTGSLTRESIRHALINGITAEQIISYLSVHAHPGMVKLAEDKLAKKLEFEAVDNSHNNYLQANQLEILPPTVIDQIRLWQIELDRIQPTKGYLYKDFANDMEFEKLGAYGDEIGVILWKDKLRKRFFVTDEGHNQLIEYANRVLRKGQGQGPTQAQGHAQHPQGTGTPAASTPTPGP